MQPLVLQRKLEDVCLPLVIVRKRSWPAVSHICSLIHLLSMRIFFILKSILQIRALCLNTTSVF